MKRRITTIFMGFALTATFTLASPSVAGATPCQDLMGAMHYHAKARNVDYYNQLVEWFNGMGC
jgi:hypothetical protein